ncbi:hypothetical protein QTP88_010177 [Uroleucon formosanum]
MTCLLSNYYITPAYRYVPQVHPRSRGWTPRKDERMLLLRWENRKRVVVFVWMYIMRFAGISFTDRGPGGGYCVGSGHTGRVIWSLIRYARFAFPDYHPPQQAIFIPEAKSFRVETPQWFSPPPNHPRG